MNIVFDWIPITSVASEINRKGLEQWQLQWNNAAKGAVCRSFFPNLEQRLKAKIPITPEFTALVTGHGKTRSYLHRFKLADDPMCPCNEGQQTSDHIIFECNIFEAQRGSMINKIVDSGGSRPPAKDKLTTIYKHSQFSLSQLTFKNWISSSKISTCGANYWPKEQAVNHMNTGTCSITM